MSDLTTPPAKHTLLAVRNPEPDHAGWRAECTCGHTATDGAYGDALRGHTTHLRESS